MKIKNVIIPAAGLGTRFLPYTKAVAKELVPLMEKPAIHSIVEEAIQSGIDAITIIANDDKHAIKEYFSSNKHLEKHLQEKNKTDLIKSISDLITSVDITFIAQPEPLGLGHAVLMAEQEIGNNYCGIMLPDEIMMGETPALAQLIEVARIHNSSVIAVQEVDPSTVSSYGIVATQKEISPGVFVIDRLVEKPTIAEAPSNLAIIGRYILSPDIFQSLKTIKPGAGGEIQLTDGIADMMSKGERVLACLIKTDRYDIGNPIGWLKANLAYCMRNEKYAQIIKDYIKTLPN